MFCARCKRIFSAKEKFTWAVLPGANMALPTCPDDRLCTPPKKKLPLVTKRMQRVRAIANRYYA